MRDQRIEEIGAAVLFKNISRERLYRRARDFALRAVAAASQGVIAERAEAAREDVKRKEREKVIAHKEERLDLVTRALVTDRKWIRNDIIGQINEIDRKNTISKLMHLPQYGPDNPAPSREFSILTLEDSKKVR